MLKDRFLQSYDLALLALSIAKDGHHNGTSVEFFLEPDTVCKVYEDEMGPICFVRGETQFNSRDGAVVKVLRLDIQYVNNDDKRRNAKAMMSGFERLANKAKGHKFSEIIFQTNNGLLRGFCERRFGFVAEDGGWLRKNLA